MKHSPGFLKIVDEIRDGVLEVSVDEARTLLEADPDLILLDVREDHEWQTEHAEGAEHLGKGILERDIETRFPDKATGLIMYCGGGFRSAMTCDVAQRMGYTNVRSLAGGYKAMTSAGWPMIPGA